MATFIISKNKQDSGDYFIHDLTQDCVIRPNPEGRVHLGEYNHCSDALVFAKNKWPKYLIKSCYCCAK